jgi:hypothetical protein
LLTLKEQDVFSLRHSNLEIVALADAAAPLICYYYVYTNQQAGRI